jgi:ferredoxin
MKIKFLPQNIEVEGSPNKSLLQIATENQLEIRSICKGVPSCAECRVRIAEGDNNVLPPGKAELGLIGTSYFIDNRRLSCQVRCFGSITVDLTEQLNKIDTQKKIKGVKTKDQKDMHAKQDTLILSDEEKVQAQAQPQHENKQAQGPKQEPRPNHRPDQKQQQNRPHHHNNNQNRNQNQKQYNAIHQ